MTPEQAAAWIGVVFIVAYLAWAFTEYLDSPQGHGHEPMDGRSEGGTRG